MEIGFFKELLPELPHPPIPLRVLLIVEQAIATAWEHVRREPTPGFDLLTAGENRITGELREVLCDIVLNQDLVNGFTRQLFVVTRDSKFRTFDGGSLNKMPDLCVTLIDRPRVRKLSHDGLFIECKPVDVDHSVGRCYCDDGLIRFVNGDYAWAMREAMMVGYVREGYTISPKLDGALQARSGTMPTVRFPSQCAKSKATRFSECVCITEHGRAFEYVETGQQAPSISIRHLWLRRD